MRSRIDAGGVQVNASMPRPPAFETAAASSGVDALPTGACTIGAVRPSLRQNGVIWRLALGGISSCVTGGCIHVLLGQCSVARLVGPSQLGSGRELLLGERVEAAWLAAGQGLDVVGRDGLQARC